MVAYDQDCKKATCHQDQTKTFKVEILKHNLQKILQESIIVINYLRLIHRTSELRLEKLV